MTLHFYSPRAYRYIRDKFNNHLPARSTMKAWYALSAERGVSGICKQSIESLSHRVTNLKNDGVEPIDEMAVREAVKWRDAEKKFVGPITYGFRADDSHLPVANNALVFMLNGVNFDMCIPIARYFIQSLKAEEKAALLEDIIIEISKLGVRVISITFDGLSTNFTACEILGAVFDLNNLDNMNPYFVVPGVENKIYVIVDASHLLKLARNTLGNHCVLSDDVGEKIEWEYFKKLN